jgi:hypothetical protein
MTRKDYVLIAAALKAANTPFCNYGADGKTAHANCAHQIADMLARDNPRFDRTRFLAAAGVAS